MPQFRKSRNMTSCTQWNYIKMMLNFVAFMVMIFLCLLPTRTLQNIRSGQFTGTNGIINNLASFNATWIFYLVILCIFSGLAFVSFPESFYSKFIFIGLPLVFLNNFSFFALPITTCRRFPFFALIVPFGSSFAFFSLLVLALRGCFCYNLLRHFRLLLISDYCLEPVAAQTAGGSSYYNSNSIYVKYNLKEIKNRTFWK